MSSRHAAMMRGDNDLESQKPLVLRSKQNDVDISLKELKAFVKNLISRKTLIISKGGDIH